MKWQIAGQRWRLRVGEDELQRLRGGDALASVSTLPRGAVFRCVLALGPASVASVDALVDGWKITLPAAAVEAHAQRLPCRDGVDFSLPCGAGVALQLLFDVDVRDSARHRSRQPR